MSNKIDTNIRKNYCNNGNQTFFELPNHIK